MVTCEITSSSSWLPMVVCSFSFSHLTRSFFSFCRFCFITIVTILIPFDFIYLPVARINHPYFCPHSSSNKTQRDTLLHDDSRYLVGLTCMSIWIGINTLVWRIIRSRSRSTTWNEWCYRSKTIDYGVTRCRFRCSWRGQVNTLGKLSAIRLSSSFVLHSWLFEEFNRDETVSTLQNQSDGTFLVRPSGTIKGDLVLCVK